MTIEQLRKQDKKHAQAIANYLIKRIETDQCLKEKIEANQNNIEALKELKGLSQELASIQAESSGSLGLNNSNQTLMQSLEMLSEYNKNFLHK